MGSRASVAVLRLGNVTTTVSTPMPKAAPSEIP
jgi:hypothetical protein